MTRVAATLLSALLIAGCSIFGDDDTPIDPPAELQEFDAKFRVQAVWDVRVGGGTEFLMLDLGPAVDGGRVFAGAHDGSVVAVDAESGRRVWDADTDLELSSGPSVGEGLVVFGTSDGDVVALDALEGSERWRTSIAGEVLAAPAIGGGTVVVRSVDGKLRALDAADGSLFWTVEQQVPRLSLRGTSSPAVVDGAVIAGFDNGRIAAYDLDDGDARWENVDTQKKVPEGWSANPANDRQLMTLGLAYQPIEQLIFKAEFQNIENEAGTGVDQVNVAMGYIF